LVLEAFEPKQSRRSDRIARFGRAVVALAADRGLDVAIYTRGEVRSCFASVGARSREEIAEAVARHIDAFQDRLPKRRRCWQPEDYRLALFSAAALVATHYQRASSQVLREIGEIGTN
jgi:Holliday junction resolvasome RuvABC endonuclease subunit